MIPTAGADLPLRERNAIINNDEFERRALHLTSYPTILFLELTQNCNLTCRMCRVASAYDSNRDRQFQI